MPLRFIRLGFRVALNKAALDIETLAAEPQPQRIIRTAAAGRPAARSKHRGKKDCRPKARRF